MKNPTFPRCCVDAGYFDSLFGGKLVVVGYNNEKGNLRTMRFVFREFVGFEFCPFCGRKTGRKSSLKKLLKKNVLTKHSLETDFMFTVGIRKLYQAKAPGPGQTAIFPYGKEKKNV